MENDKSLLHLRRLGIDTYKEAVIYMPKTAMSAAQKDSRRRRRLPF